MRTLRQSLAFLSCCAVLALTAPMVEAATASTTASAPAGGNNSAFESAMSSCVAQAGKDAQGGPNRQAVDSCMQAKGYSKPAGGPPPGNGQPPKK